MTRVQFATRMLLAAALAAALFCVPASVRPAFADTSLGGAVVELYYTNYEFNGEEICPPIKRVTLDGKHVGRSGYTVSYANNINAGVGEITLTGKNGYIGTTTVFFDITRADINDVDIAAATMTRPYSGSEWRPALDLSLGDYVLQEGRDYTATYSAAPILPGTYKLDIAATENGNFTGSLPTFDYVITPVALSGANVSLGSPLAYTGSRLDPDITVTGAYGNELSPSTDYDLSLRTSTGTPVSSIVDAGDYQAVIEGKGGYEGAVVYDFTVAPASLADAEVALTPTEFAYDGTQKRPQVSVSLGGRWLASSNYTVTYENNVYAGEGRAVVTGRGNFGGSVTRTFTINPVVLDDDDVSLLADSAGYTGAPVIPPISVSDPDGNPLIPGTDYTVSYADAAGNPVEAPVEAGRYTVTVTGAGGYSGTITRPFTVKPGDLGNAEITVSPDPYPYVEGQPATPDVVVKLDGNVVDPSNYQVTYSDNAALGTGTVTVRGIGSLGGEKSATFAIANQQPMYRLYYPLTGEHFYTRSEEERDTLIYLQWNDEGIAWMAPIVSDIPVYRLFSGIEHHYTTSLEERNHLLSPEGGGWTDEGIGWYSATPDRTPVYRLFNPSAHNAGAHHYTVSAVERDHLIFEEGGWNNEGIGWYAL